MREVVAKHGLFCSLYTDRGSHYFFTPEGGGPVSRTVLTQFGRALKQLGIEHIAAYSPQARGRSEGWCARGHRAGSFRASQSDDDFAVLAELSFEAPSAQRCGEPTVDIAGWLRSLGLDRYEAAFLENEVTADMLPDLTADDLKELGASPPPIGGNRCVA